VEYNVKLYRHQKTNFTQAKDIFIHLPVYIKLSKSHKTRPSLSKWQLFSWSRNSLSSQNPTLGHSSQPALSSLHFSLHNRNGYGLL